jgi:hypothetical protein
MNFAMADLDGDGRFDLVASDVYGVSVYLAMADGGFGSPVLYALPVDTRGSVFTIGAGDLRGTGRMDLVVVSADLQLASHIYVYPNAGGGTFLDPFEVTPSVTTDGPQLVIYDVNHDGFDDLLEMNGYSSVYLWLSEGDGGFEQSSLFLQLEYPGPAPTWAQPMTLLPPTDAGACLAISTWSDAAVETWQVMVLCIGADGTFSDGALFPTTGYSASDLYPGFITSADIDGDGIADLVLSGGYSNDVQLLPGLSGRSFGSFQLLSINGTVNGICQGGVAPLGSVAAPGAVVVADHCNSRLAVIGNSAVNR